MDVTYERDEHFNVKSVSIELPIKTEYGWATAVYQDTVNEYEHRGSKSTEVQKRLDVIENCPDVLNELKQPFPDFFSHKMWDTEGVKELD